MNWRHRADELNGSQLPIWRKDDYHGDTKGRQHSGSEIIRHSPLIHIPCHHDGLGKAPMRIIGTCLLSIAAIISVGITITPEAAASPANRGLRTVRTPRRQAGLDSVAEHLGPDPR